MVSSDFGRMLSVGAIHFEEWFYTSKKGGIGGGGRASRGDAMRMAAALAGYRRALVGIGWTISHLVSTNELRNHSSPCRGTISEKFLHSFCYSEPSGPLHPTQVFYRLENSPRYRSMTACC